jgi:hypothetical protein
MAEERKSIVHSIRRVVAARATGHAALAIALGDGLGPIRVAVRRVRAWLDAHVIDGPGVDVAPFATI